MENMPNGFNLTCLCTNPKCNAVFSARSYYANGHRCPICNQHLYESCIIFGFTEEQSYQLACALRDERVAKKEEQNIPPE